MRIVAAVSILTLCFAFTTLTKAEASEMPQDNTAIYVSMGLAATVLTVPLGVNTYSALSETPTGPLWHWSGYGIGGLSFVLGSVGLAANLGSDNSGTTWLATGFMGYGACHVVAAYFASDIKPENTAGVVAPLVVVGEEGEHQLGLAWFKRF